MTDKPPVLNDIMKDPAPIEEIQREHIIDLTLELSKAYDEINQLKPYRDKWNPTAITSAQRRLETATQILCGAIAAGKDLTDVDKAIRGAIEIADALIKAAGFP